MFEKVKFLYNQEEDLEVGGIIFWLLVHARKAAYGAWPICMMPTKDQCTYAAACSGLRLTKKCKSGIKGPAWEKKLCVANKFTGKAVEGSLFVFETELTCLLYQSTSRMVC